MNRTIGAAKWFLERLEGTGYLTPEQALEFLKLRKQHNKEADRIFYAAMALSRSRSRIAIKAAKVEATTRGEWRKRARLSLSSLKLSCRYHWSSVVFRFGGSPTIYRFRS